MRKQCRHRRPPALAANWFPPRPATRRRPQCPAWPCPALGTCCRIGQLARQRPRPARVLPQSLPRDAAIAPQAGAPAHQTRRSMDSKRCSSASRRLVIRSIASGRSLIVPNRSCAVHSRSVARRGCGRALFRPRRQQLYQHPQDEQRQNNKANGHQQPFLCHQVHFVGRVAEKAL